MTNLPANLPSIARAKLPAVYEQARGALATCERIDECKDWADKAEALASYAKQAQDDALRKMADRIQARAIRRCGELLRAIEANAGGRPSKTRDGADPSFTRKQAARDAGLSERQHKTAIRVARIPGDEFDAAVESNDPPTVTALAEQGKLRGPSVNLHGRDPRNFARATTVLGWLQETKAMCRKHDTALVAAGLSPRDISGRDKIINDIKNIQEWLRELAKEILRIKE